MKILCKKPKKDIDVILKKQKFVSIIKNARHRARGIAGSWGVFAGGHSDEQTDRWIWKLKEKNIYLKILQEEEFIFSLSACDLFISSIHLLVLSIFFSPTSKNHVKLLPPNTYKKTFILPLEGEPKNSSRALHRGRERNYSMSSCANSLGSGEKIL